MIKRILFATIIVIGTCAATAQIARPDMLVSPEWVQSNAATITVVHIGDRAGFEAAHVPDAVFVDAQSIVTSVHGVPNELPPPAALGRVFTAAGIDRHSRIVVYSDDPLLAARAWFTLDYLGQGARTSILDGGLARWKSEGRAVDTGANASLRIQPGTIHVRPDLSTIVKKSDVANLVRWQTENGSNIVLIDARTPEQFENHIAGAVNVPWQENFTSGAVPTLRPVEELRAIYESAGVKSGNCHVVYCRTGMQAAVTYFVIKLLGYDVSLYDGSYAEWTM